MRHDAQSVVGKGDVAEGGGAGGRETSFMVGNVVMVLCRMLIPRGDFFFKEKGFGLRMETSYK